MTRAEKEKSIENFLEYFKGDNPKPCTKTLVRVFEGKVKNTLIKRVQEGQGSFGNYEEFFEFLRECASYFEQNLPDLACKHDGMCAFVMFAIRVDDIEEATRLYYEREKSMAIDVSPENASIYKEFCSKPEDMLEDLKYYLALIGRFYSNDSEVDLKKFFKVIKPILGE